MKNKKCIILIVSHILTCFVSVVATFAYFGWSARDSMSSFNSMLNGSILMNRYALHVDLQEAYGSQEEYQEALFAFLKALDQAKKLEPADPMLSPTIFFTDETLAFTRLAKLAKEQRDKEQFIKFKELAISACKNIPWSDCSYEQLVKVSIRYDKQKTINFVE